MTNNNTTTMTQAAALEWLIAHAPEGTPEDVMTKANELYTAKTKKYDRPKTESPTAKKNRALIDPVVAFVANYPNDLVNATFIAANMNHPEITSPQKARIIADMAIAEGKLEKYIEGKRPYYKVA